MPSFHIVDDPWLDVLRSDGTASTISLRELLTGLHQIDRLSESSPLTEVALLRFLIALLSDGLRDLVPTEDAWLPFVEQCQKGLPVEAIEAILQPLMESPDVLAADHAGFFDGPLVRRVAGWHAPNAKQPVSRFLPELPTGTNLSHFVHLSDDSAAVCVACLLKSRAIDAAFARGGLGPSLSRNLLATISGTEPRYVVLTATSLLDTLLINLLTGDASQPSWMSIHRKQAGNPGPISRMSWRPRLIFPTTVAEPGLPCVSCATITRPRFSDAVMVDTYNHSGSPFGSKTDLEKWKATGRDPHLLPVVKNELSLGLNPIEWPLRALTRLLAGERSAPASVLVRRCASRGLQVSVRVTSSAGNQAKIDDAPSASLLVPIPLLQHSESDYAAVATALATIFDRENQEARERLIPVATPHLLCELVAGTDPMEVVSNWLRSKFIPGKRRSRATDSGVVAECERTFINHATDQLTDSARRIVRRLAELPATELQALKPRSRGGAVDRAVRQDAFEQVWHRLSLPGASKRHAMREALVTVAGIFAVHADRCRFQTERGSFAMSLKTHIQRERQRSASRNDVGPIERLTMKLVTASPIARDDLLLRLVDQLVAGSPHGSSRSIDFADLLIDVVLWNALRNPTPARWHKLLNDTASIAATQ